MAFKLNATALVVSQTVQSAFTFFIFFYSNKAGSLYTKPILLLSRLSPRLSCVCLLNDLLLISFSLLAVWAWVKWGGQVLHPSGCHNQWDFNSNCLVFFLFSCRLIVFLALTLSANSDTFPSATHTPRCLVYSPLTVLYDLPLDSWCDLPTLNAVNLQWNQYLICCVCQPQGRDQTEIDRILSTSWPAHEPGVRSHDYRFAIYWEIFCFF